MKIFGLFQETSMDNVVDAVKEIITDLLIIEYIQTFTMENALPARAGSPTQTMECANELLEIAKNTDKRQRAVIIAWSDDRS